jgi:hypothetical protein
MPTPSGAGDWEGRPIEADAGDPSRRILAEVRSLADAGRLDTAIGALRDFVVEFPQYAHLNRELEALRARAGHYAPRPRTVVPPPPAQSDSPASQPPSSEPIATPHVSPVRRRWPAIGGVSRGVVGIAGVATAVVAVGLFVIRGRFDSAPAGDVRTSSGFRPSPALLPSEALPSVDGPLTPDPPVAEPVARMSDAPTLRGPHPEPSRGPTPGAPAVMAARRPGEAEVSWRLRSRDLDLRYQSATAAIAEGHFADALIWLSAVIEEEASYRNAPELLERVYQARRERASAIVREGVELEARGRLAEAAAIYDRALAIDPELPEAMERLQAVQAITTKRMAEAVNRAAVHEAFGLTGDAANAYQEVLALARPGSTERRLAEDRLAVIGLGTRPLVLGAMPPSMRLDLMEARETLDFVEDAGGRFIARLPTRRWQLTPGAGSTIGVVTERDGRGSLIVEAEPLSGRVSLEAHYDLVVMIESRLIARRHPTATLIVHRKLDPPLPMVVLDYRRPAPGGQQRRVRQFSLTRGQTLYRISATNGLAPFYEVEGVFNDFAISFQPTDRPPAARP